MGVLVECNSHYSLRTDVCFRDEVDGGCIAAGLIGGLGISQDGCLTWDDFQTEVRTQSTSLR